MKRNELLQRITDILTEDTDCVYFDVPHHKIAEHILSTCEKAGMLPPKIYDDILLRNENKWEIE